LRFLPYVSCEAIPPATFRLWRHTGLVQILPLWVCITAPSIFFVAADHSYGKLLELSINAAAILIGIALQPIRRAGKRAKAIAYLPSCIVIMTPSIIIAVLDRRYDHVLELLVVAVLLFVGISLLAAKWPDKPAAEIENDVLTIRMAGNVPAKSERISLRDLRQVIISGPRHSRDWVFDFKDGSKRAFRPHLARGADEALVAILREVNAGRFEVSVEAPLFLEL